MFLAISKALDPSAGSIRQAHGRQVGMTVGVGRCFLRLVVASVVGIDFSGDIFYHTSIIAGRYELAG